MVIKEKLIKNIAKYLKMRENIGIEIIGEFESDFCLLTIFSFSPLPGVFFYNIFTDKVEEILASDEELFAYLDRFSVKTLLDGLIYLPSPCSVSGNYIDDIISVIDEIVFFEFLDDKVLITIKKNKKGEYIEKRLGISETIIPDIKSYLSNYDFNNFALAPCLSFSVSSLIDQNVLQNVKIHKQSDRRALFRECLTKFRGLVLC